MPVAAEAVGFPIADLAPLVVGERTDLPVAVDGRVVDRYLAPGIGHEARIAEPDPDRVWIGRLLGGTAAPRGQCGDDTQRRPKKLGAQGEPRRPDDRADM